jgi:RNA polymerase sigma-70 factor (ECF subfamily)
MEPTGPEAAFRRVGGAVQFLSTFELGERLPSPGEITGLLAAMRRGDERAASQLVSAVYAELHSLACRYMNRERRDHTLQPTALVHETWLRLIKQRPADLNDRAHFFAVAATVMRRCLVDYARERGAAKRPAGKVRIELEDRAVSEPPRVEQVVILDEALRRLAKAAPRQARIVEMIYFGGLTQHEAAAVLDLDERTIKRDWASARAWLQSQLGGNGK